MHRALEACRRQPWQQAAVVDMRMGQHHRIQCLRVEGEVGAVACFVLAAALLHAALQEYPGTCVGFDQVAGACDLLDGAEKTEQSHGMDSCLVDGAEDACCQPPAS